MTVWRRRRAYVRGRLRALSVGVLGVNTSRLTPDENDGAYELPTHAGSIASASRLLDSLAPRLNLLPPSSRVVVTGQM